MVSGRSKQAYKHTHTREQCSHASVGLAQARPNYWFTCEAIKLKEVQRGREGEHTILLYTMWAPLWGVHSSINCANHSKQAGACS